MSLTVEGARTDLIKFSSSEFACKLPTPASLPLIVAYQCLPNFKILSQCRIMSTLVMETKGLYALDTSESERRLDIKYTGDSSTSLNGLDQCVR